MLSNGAKDTLLAAVPATLVEDTQSWMERADLWHLVARGEALAERVEIIAVKSNLLEAWVCGPQKICLSTRLLREFPPEEQQAVVAHEIGHLLIPRDYAAHPQLWETQCDLFAATLLRDAELVKRMLDTLAADCASCRDNEHPTPRARAALVEHFSTAVLAKVFKYDEFRQRSYAVHFKIELAGVPAKLKELSFALRTAPVAEVGRTEQPNRLHELKRLSFAIGFYHIADVSQRTDR